MTVVNKIDKFLNEAKKSKSGYYKVGVANDYSGPIKVMEIAQETSINKARQSYAGKYKYVFTQPASKQDFMDFSNGKTVKWVGPIKEGFTLKDIPKEFMEDPLYKAVLTAKDKQSYDKALKTLLSIRGRGAVDSLKYAMEKNKR